MFVSFEGSVGSGKSTLSEHFKTYVAKQHINISFYEEPLELWTNYYVDAYNRSIFDYYYKDPARWSFTFQFVAMQTRYNTYMQAIKDTSETKSTIFFERSIFADYIFSKILYDRQCMNDIEFKIYTNWFKFFYNQLPKPPQQKFIYIKTSPEECLKRIKKRNRQSEDGIDLSFLQDLTKYHNKWFNHENIDDYVFESSSNMMVIDGHENFKTNPDNTIEQILKFIL